MASQALLGTFASVKGSSKKGRRTAPKRAKATPALLLDKLVPDMQMLVDLLPDQVTICFLPIVANRKRNLLLV